MKIRSLPLLLLPALLWLAPPAQAASLARAGQTCHLPGMEEGLRCLTVAVPSSYAAPGGAQIKLHVTIAPAFRETPKADPLFVLAGGPGEGGSDLLPLLDRVFSRVRATRDIVLIDQRGTGLSGKLDCPSKPNEETMSEEQAEADLKDCIARLNKPLGDYTTANAVQDIERVRTTLKLGQINLWGGSYGTRLGQAYLRAFPANVRAAVLDGVAAPDQVIPAGGKDAQAALDALFTQCAADQACHGAYPNLRQEFAALLEKVGHGNLELDVADPRTAQQRKLTMTNTRFLGTVHSILYNPVTSRSLPFLLHSAYTGRWEPFVTRSNAMSDFSTDTSIATVMHLAVVCAEDVPRLTPELAQEDAKGSFMSTGLLKDRARMCEAMKVPAARWSPPTRIDAPVLMFSGGLDPVTPPRRAQAAAKDMSHVQHFVVPNAGHGISTLGCAPRLIREFLDQPTRTLNGACLKDIPTASFQIGPAGPQP